MIKFVLGKVTFSPQYSFSYFTNSEKLLGIDESLDPLVFEYIQSYMAMIELVGYQIPTAELVTDGPNDIEAFAILPYTTENDWDNFLASREMSGFMNSVHNLFPRLGWTHHGYKIIRSFEEPLIRTRYELDKIWNSN